MAHNFDENCDVCSIENARMICVPAFEAVVQSIGAPVHPKCVDTDRSSVDCVERVGRLYIRNDPSITLKCDVNDS